MIRLLCSALLLVALTGCLERKETIRIEPGGGVEMLLRFEADSFDELYRGDAVPDGDRQWLVDERVEVDADDNEKFILEATQWFGPKNGLPADYASPSSPYADLVLRFPTTVTIEPRREGTYYHFRRVYQPRRWAYVEGPRERVLALMREEVPEGTSFELLGPAERATIARTYLQVELEKIATFARAAFVDVCPECPQDAWLEIRTVLGDYMLSIDVEHAIDLVLTQDEDPEAQRELAAFLAAIETGAVDMIVQTLRHGDAFPIGRIRRFESRLAYHGAEYMISEDLGDDRFEIVVHFPGRVSGHNGRSSTESSVTWTFDGQALRDRPLELIATAVAK